MGDTIIINYGKFEEAGRNITRLKESLYRIDRSIEAERQVHADDKGEAADALESKRCDIQTDIKNETEKLEHIIDLIGTVHWELSALLQAENESLDMKVDPEKAKACIDKYFEVAERCLGLLYADPCMDPHNDIWVSDGLGGGHYIPDEEKLSRERRNGHTMESLEDELYKARSRVREEQAYADRWFGEKVLAFENMDAEIAWRVKSKHQDYMGRHPADLVLEKAETSEIDTIEIPGFPGFEFDPENFDYWDIQSYITGELLRGVGDSLIDLLEMVPKMTDPGSEMVHLLVMGIALPDVTVKDVFSEYYGGQLNALLELTTNPVGIVTGIADYYKTMYNEEGLAYLMGTLIPDIVIGTLTGGGAFASKSAGTATAQIGAVSGSRAAYSGPIRSLINGLKAKIPSLKKGLKFKGSSKLTGYWKLENEGMPELSRIYQKQITGRSGEVWLENGVKFDGMKNGRLIEVKGDYSGFIDKSTGNFERWFAESKSGGKSFIKQAERQIKAANGNPIDWYFMNQEDMIIVQRLLIENRVDIQKIKFIYEPLK